MAELADAQIQVNIGPPTEAKAKDGCVERAAMVRTEAVAAESDLTLILQDLCLGHTVADVIMILGSVDIVMGEVDR